MIHKGDTDIYRNYQKLLGGLGTLLLLSTSHRRFLLGALGSVGLYVAYILGGIACLVISAIDSIKSDDILRRHNYM